MTGSGVEPAFKFGVTGSQQRQLPAAFGQRGQGVQQQVQPLLRRQAADHDAQRAVGIGQAHLKAQRAGIGGLMPPIKY